MSQHVAYLILAHAVNEELRLLIDALLSDQRSAVYLHIDAKIPDLGWLSDYSNPSLVVLPNRRIVNWAGYSVVDATLRLLRSALADASNRQFALLSGACFPLRSQKSVNDRILSLSGPSVSLWGRVSPELRQGEGLGRYIVTKVHLHDDHLLPPKRSGLHERVWSVYKKINARLPYERKVDISDLWKGSQFFILDREYAKICAQPPGELVQAMRYALAPDEIFFTTMIMRHARSVGLALPLTSESDKRLGAHFIIKRPPEGRRNLTTRLFGQVDLRKLSLTDAAEALSSGALFARKCSEEVSLAIRAAWKA